MFPYLKPVKEFLKDCETITHKIEKNSKGIFVCEQLKTGYEDQGCLVTCDSKKKGSCSCCKNVPAVVAWLIQSVDQANWGNNRSHGLGHIDFREVRAWCHSLCVHMYEVLKPLEDMNLFVGLEYYLETRAGFVEDKKKHYRVDVMIGGYGKDNSTEPVERLMVIELKQYGNSSWDKDGKTLTYEYGNDTVSEESPNRQVKFYCDSISKSIDKNSIAPDNIIPCVFMHNLAKDKIEYDPGTPFDDSSDGVLYDNRVKYRNKPIPIFISEPQEHDRYKAFRSYICETFDHEGTDVRAIDVFKKLKKGHHVLSQEELADMLICDADELESRFRALLRPDQFFTMFGYGEYSYSWDNYLKNHIDYRSIFSSEENKTFWNHWKQERGVLDIIEGGPGSGKTVLSMFLVRYCLMKGLSVAYVYIGSAQVNRLFDYLKNIIEEEVGVDERFPDIVKNIPRSKLDNFRIFNSYKENEKFDIIPFEQIKNKMNYDVYVIDDAHVYREIPDKENTGKRNIDIIKDLEENGKMVFLFYDRHQIIDEGKKGEDESKKSEYYEYIENIIDHVDDRNLFQYQNAFRLWSMFRCNRNDGYLSWIESILDIVPQNTGTDAGAGIDVDVDVDVDGDVVGFDVRTVDDIFDFDVRIIDDEQLKQLAKEVKKEKQLRVFSELPIESKLEELLGQKVYIYNGPNGKMPPVDKDGKINIGRAIKERGIESERVIVILDDNIKLVNGKITGSDSLKKRYRILLTRGMKECYIYVMDEALREYMMESLSERN